MSEAFVSSYEIQLPLLSGVKICLFIFKIVAPSIPLAEKCGSMLE